MKRSLATLLFALSPCLPAAHAEQLIPAGSVMQCLISDTVSAKTTHLGDPILCQVSHTELHGRSVFPYGSYMVGHFEEYKDPGHFVGKGWMELKFDRIIVGNDTVIPISSRVVATSGKNPVDKDGRIHGTGHPVRDTVEWMIPVLWPIDLINLPRRGPEPVLKAETRLTVKLLDDLGIPTKKEVQHLPELISRYNYADDSPSQQDPAPIERPVAQQSQTYAPPPPQSYAPAPVQQSYAQPNPTVIVVQAPAPAAPTIIQQPAPQMIVQQPPVYIQHQPTAFIPYPAPPYAYSPYGPVYPPVAYGRYYRPY